MFIARTLAFLFLSAFTAMAVKANPVLDHVTEGDVNVIQQDTKTTVNQNSQQAIIDWRSFNINANESTHFDQPAGGVALNRISPLQGPSQIYGLLSATGKIILVNQAGIFFGSGAVVDVGSLIASTSDISNQNFKAGKFIFDHASPYFGSVINRGTIIAKEHGLVALVGTGVSNEGYIQAKSGTVVLASGNKFVVTFAGDDLISFAVEEEATHSANGLNTAVNNSGVIKANGGKIIMTAKVAQGVVNNVINMDGVAQAKSIGSRNGEIYLLAENGVVNVSGKLIATSKTQKGGNIKIVGKEVKIQAPAVVDVSGGSHAGQITIGGYFSSTKLLSVASGVNLIASSSQGVGGDILLSAEKLTTFAGNIFATGNTKGGSVKILAEKVKVSAPAKIDVSGTTGGGEILIGGNFQGLGPEPNALLTLVEPNVVLKASALDRGNGGKIIVWSDKATQFAGEILALGGLNGGNGGFAEVSSKGLLAFNGKVNLTAPKGITGTLLLDPENVTISHAIDTNIGDFDGADPNTYNPTANNSNINIATLTELLNTADVKITTGSVGNQEGDITVQNNFAWSSSHNLTLDAFRNIIFNGSVNNTGAGQLILVSASNGTLQFPNQTNTIFFTGAGSGFIPGLLTFRGFSRFIGISGKDTADVNTSIATGPRKGTVNIGGKTTQLQNIQLNPVNNEVKNEIITVTQGPVELAREEEQKQYIEKTMKAKDVGANIVAMIEHTEKIAQRESNHVCIKTNKAAKGTFEILNCKS